MIIKVKDVIGSKFAIKEEKGKVLYEELKKHLRNREKEIVLDFSNITASTTRFFNVSISKLYSEFPFNLVDNIIIRNANSVLGSQLEVSKDGAKEFYKSSKL